MTFHKHIDMAITRLRYAGAEFRARRHDDRLIRAYRCRDPGQVFYIVGAGASLNELSEDDFRRIEAGTSAAINMAAVAPIAFDIYSIELVANAHLAESLASKVRGQSKPAIFWHQDRKKHENAHLRALKAEFPMHSYRRVSVSVRRRLSSFVHIYRGFMRHKVFETPNLNLSFALTGSVARLVLLACALGYRRICLVGIDLNGTPYFWQEGRHLRGQPPWVDASGLYAPRPVGANTHQAGSNVVPNLYDFLTTLIVDRGTRLDISVLDPGGRSALTRFFADRREPEDPAVLVEQARRR